MKKYFLISATIILFGSCQKDEITVKLRTSGTLSVKVVDNNKQAMANEKVGLYTYYSSGTTTTSSLLDKIATNSNGEVNFGELAEGSYTLVVDTPKVNGVKYLPIKPIQVLSNINKSVTINVQEYTGTIKINLTNSNNNPLANYNVILIPSEKYNSSDNVNTCISKAEFRSTSNSAGQATFQVPSSRDFVIMVYDNAKTNVDRSHYASVSKDETNTVSVQTYF